MKPLANETQPEFAIRFHEASMASIPDTDQRTSACFAAWDAAHPQDELRSIAYSRFAQGYQHVPNVCQFVEHTTSGRNGDTTIYDRNALVAVLSRCNDRIADTGDFAPIVEGHTPDADEVAKGRPQPEVLGYTGPYKLGMIGRKSPRWAIFADEHHEAGSVDKLRKLRRRSPEVWLEEKMEDRFFDPIAALGATTPRLDMGMVRMHRNSSGRLVAKYSAGTMPGATNTFVESDEIRDYAAGDADVEPENTVADAPEQNALSPEAVQQIVVAIMETEHMQWVQSQMAESAQSVIPEAAPPEGAASPDATGAGAAPAPPAPAAEADPTDGMGDEEKKHYECMPPEKQAAYSAWKKNYEAGSVEEEPVNKQEGKVTENLDSPEESTVTDKFQKLSAQRQKERADMAEKERYEKLEKEHKALRESVEKMQYEKRCASREGTLQKLRYERAFELEDEIAICDPLKMSDDQFSAHVECIKKNYQRIPAGLSVHHPDIDLQQRSDDEFKAKCADEAQKYCLAERAKGNHVEWSEAMTIVKEKYGKKTA